jgi:hypothetical protein
VSHRSLPSCPRCGYDLTGVVESWQTCCPLGGTCSECGLEFRWRELLSAEGQRLIGSFEHAQFHIARAFLTTIWWTVRPWKLWSVIGMHHEIRWKRLAWFVVLGIPALQLVMSLVAYGVWLCSYLLAPTKFRYPGWPRRVLLDALWFNADDLSFLAFFVTWWVLMPVTFLLLPVTLRKCRVRRAHLARIAAYSLVFGVGVLAAIYELSYFTRLIAFEICKILVRLGVGTDPFSLYQQLPLKALEQLRVGYVIIFFGGPALFWGLAGRRYLKIPHAWPVSLLMTFLSMLVVALLSAAWVVMGGAV